MISETTTKDFTKQNQVKINKIRLKSELILQRKQRKIKILEMHRLRVQSTLYFVMANW